MGDFDRSSLEDVMLGFIGRFIRALIVLIILLFVVVLNNIRGEEKEPQLYVRRCWDGPIPSCKE
jgi:hypothetical protein